MTLELEKIGAALKDAGQLLQDGAAGDIVKAEADAAQLLADLGITIKAEKLKAELDVIARLADILYLKKDSMVDDLRALASDIPAIL